MATIKVKRSAVAGRIPATTDLELGEIAINTYDGVAYIKKNVSGTETVVSLGGNVELSQNLQNRYQYTATANQTTFAAVYLAPYVDVYLNGVRLLIGVEFTATNGTSIVLASGASAGNVIDIVAYTTYTANANYADLSNSIVVSALGFTPYNATNPSNFITQAQARDAISASGSLSYNSSTGVISYTTPTTSGITEGTNLYFTDARARGAVSAGTGLTYNSSTGVITNSITQYTDALARAAISVTGAGSYNSTTGVITVTGGVTSVAGRTGAIILTNADVGLGSVEDKSSATIRGEITSSNVTAALGFTPYNATNPSSYITTAGARSAISATGSLSYNSTTGVLSYTAPTAVSAFTNDSGYLTANQSISVTGDATGSGATAISLTLANSGVTAGTYTKTTVDAKGRVTSGSTLSASDIPELDASKITTGVFDAARLPSYVDDVLEYANLAGFPASGETGKIYVALDTNKTYRWSGSAYVYITSGAVDSVAGKTGVVTLTSNDVGLGLVENKSSATIRGEITSTNVTSALGFTPYNATNPSGYTNNTGTVTSVTGTGTVSGLTLTGSVTTTGSLTLGGTLSLTSANVTGALGFTPYNATNPAGYITGITSGMVTTALGFTPYNATNPAGYITSAALGSYLPLSGGTLTGKLKISLAGGTTPSNFFEINNTAAAVGNRAGMQLNTGPSWSTTIFTEQGNWWHAFGNDVGVVKWGYDGTDLKVGSSTVLHAGNYNSYAPTLTGTGASGTWSISITGTAGAANSATSAGYLTGGDSGFYGLLYNTLAGDLNTYNSPGLYSAEYIGVTNRPTASNGHLIQISDAGGTDVKTQWYFPSAGVTPYMRLMWGNTNWNSWIALLTSSNYSSYALPLSGGALTGNVTLNTSDGEILVTPTGWRSSDRAAIKIRSKANTPAEIDLRHTVGGVESGWHISARDTSSASELHFYRFNMNSAGAADSAGSFLQMFTFRADGSFNTAGAITQSGSQVLTAGNYSSYALPLSGGTLTGTLYFTDTTNGLYKSGGRLNVRSESTDNVAEYASYGLYLPKSGQAAGLYVESPIEARGGLRLGNSAGSGTITVGATTDATANRLVQRDGSGHINAAYVFGTYFNSNAGNSENPTIGQVWTQSTGDNYLRKSTPAHFISQLGLLTTSNYSSYALPLSGGTLTGDLLWTGYPKIGIADNGADCYMYITDDNPTHDGVGYGGEFWLYGDKSVDASLLRAGGAAFTNAPTVSGNRVLHAGNYNSYSPTLTGGGASGTWGINVTGSAGSAGSATSAGYSSYLYSQDIRTLSPSSTSAYRMGFGFTSWANNNTASYADYLALRSYTDGSGGNDNLVMFNKNSIAMRVWQQAWNSASAYSTYADVLMSNNYNNYSPTLTGGNASGTWGINVTGNANSASTLNSGATINGTAYFRKNQTAGDYTTAALWTESYGNTTTGIAFHISGVAGRFLEMRNNSAELFWQSAAILNAGNYTNYAAPASHSHNYIPINPDGDGNAWSYADENPTINGVNVGGGQRFGADGSSYEGFLQAKIVNAHNGFVNSANGYYVGNYDFGANSNTFSTTRVIDGSGNITGGSITSSGNQVLHAGNYTSYSPSLGGSGASGTWSINVTGSSSTSNQTYRGIIEDTRAGLRSPNAYDDYRAHFEFTDKIVSDWHTAFTMQGWHDGYAAWQIIGPASTSAHENFYLRSGINTSWNSVRTILHSGNYSSYALPLSGGTVSGATYFASNQGGYIGSLSSPPLQAYSSSNNAAYMSFHKGGQYAVNFGLDADNVLRIGGWSASANRWQLDMSGNGTYAGNVTAYSDERLKKDWALVQTDFITKLAKVKSGTYTRIDSEQRQAGVSAQDFQKLLPETVSEDNAGTLSLAYGNAALVSAVELAKEVIDLRAQVTELRALIITLINKDLS